MRVLVVDDVPAMRQFLRLVLAELKVPHVLPISLFIDPSSAGVVSIATDLGSGTGASSQVVTHPPAIDERAAWCDSATIEGRRSGEKL